MVKCDPRHGKYMACCLLYRSNKSDDDCVGGGYVDIICKLPLLCWWWWRGVDDTDNISGVMWSRRMWTPQLQRSRQNGQSSSLIGAQPDSRCLHYHLHRQCIMIVLGVIMTMIIMATIILMVTISIIPISMDFSFVIPINYTAGIIIGTNLIKKNPGWDQLSASNCCSWGRSRQSCKVFLFIFIAIVVIIAIIIIVTIIAIIIIVIINTLGVGQCCKGWNVALFINILVIIIFFITPILIII